MHPFQLAIDNKQALFIEYVKHSKKQNHANCIGVQA